MAQLSSNELCKKTGATYRQIDYWCRLGFITEAEGTSAVGSGSRRRFDDSILPWVETLLSLSNLFQPHHLPDTILEIKEKFETGNPVIALDDRLILVVVDKEA